MLTDHLPEPLPTVLAALEATKPGPNGSTLQQIHMNCLQLDLDIVRFSLGDLRRAGLVALATHFYTIL